MSLPNEAAGINSDINAANIPESSSNNNSAEIKKAANKLITQINSESSFREETYDNHLKRLQNLRNELNYINDTDWMYESLDKKPQQ